MSSPEILRTVEDALCDHFGHQPTRASVSFVGVEPVEVLRFEPVVGERAYLTLGMSRRPMTEASDEVMTEHGRRAELLLRVRASSTDDAWRQLAVLGAAPAVEGVVYRPGMTLDLGQPLASGSACTGVVVIDSGIPQIETAAGVVEVLGVQPATGTELAWSRIHGSSKLRARWSAQRVDLLDLGRRAAQLG